MVEEVGRLEHAEKEFETEKARLVSELEVANKKATDEESARYKADREKEQAGRDLDMERAEVSYLRDQLAKLEKTRTELHEACVGGQVAGYRQGLFQMLDKIRAAGLSYQQFLSNLNVDLLVQDEAAGEYVSKLAAPAPQRTDSIVGGSPSRAEDGLSGGSDGKSPEMVPETPPATLPL